MAAAAETRAPEPGMTLKHCICKLHSSKGAAESARHKAVNAHLVGGSHSLRQRALSHDVQYAAYSHTQGLIVDGPAAVVLKPRSRPHHTPHDGARAGPAARQRAAPLRREDAVLIC